MVNWINLVMWILSLWILQRSKDVLWRWLLWRWVQWLWAHWGPKLGQVRWSTRRLDSSWYTFVRLDYAVPEPVKKFLQYFQDMIKVYPNKLKCSLFYCFQEGNVYEVNNLYETSFPKLTDQFFKVRISQAIVSSILLFQGVAMARGRGCGPLCQRWPHLP